MKNNPEWFVADFETTTEKYYIENGITKVWLYAISDKNSNIIKYGNSIEDFFEFINSYKKNVIYYFHNLKFDGSFILNYLINNNYKYQEKITLSDTNKFSTLIGEMGEFYSIKYNVKKNFQITFCDSLKLLPFKVEKIAIDFGLPILKGKIDYDNYEINEETLNYVFNDVKIVAMALNEIKKNGMIKMTTASCAYNEYSNMTFYINNLFPDLEKDFLVKWRGAYRGGRSMVNDLHRNKILKNVKRFDINSMYPYIMREMELPYGEPIKCNRNEYNFELYDVNISFKLKKGHLPCILKKGSLGFGEDSYYTETEGVENLKISSIDFQLLEINYDIEYLEFIEILGFKTTKYLFRKYIDKYYEIKNREKGAKKLIAKLMLNSLYGKFGSKPEGKTKKPILVEESLKFEYNEKEDMKHYYLPIAIAITSYAHKLLDDNIRYTGIENFVYCDTDSIHTLGDLPKELIDNKELGKFKLEGIEKISKYIRQKCYVVKDEDNSIKITCAGMPENLKEKAISIYNEEIFNVFERGFSINGKLLPKQVKGGVILKETTFQII